MTGLDSFIPEQEFVLNNLSNIARKFFYPSKSARILIDTHIFGIQASLNQEKYQISTQQAVY